MDLGFPDMSMVINIIFFLLVALFLILAAKMIMERSEPKFVVSTAFIPALPSLSKKGFTGILKFIIMALVCFAVLIALFFLFAGEAQAMAGSIGSGLLDWLPFL